MKNIILIHVENRPLKGFLLKSISNADMDFVDIIDIDDLNLKLDAFGSKICMLILEITDWNMNAVKVEIDRLKGFLAPIPMLAVVSKDTAEIVTFAMRSGIRDILLLPKNRELYQRTVQEKMGNYYERFNPQKFASEREDRLYREHLENRGIHDYLGMELKRSKRGGYPLTMVMAKLTGEGPELIKDLDQSVKNFLRDTDRILVVDDQTFIGVFPFTQKDYVPIIEQKFRQTFDREIGKTGNHKRLCIYGVTYPPYETSLETLLKRMENGIKNSMVINSIQTPLNDLSRSEIESYKQKIRQYRRFL